MNGISLFGAVMDYAPLGKIIAFLTFSLPIISLSAYFRTIIVKNSIQARKAFWWSVSTLLFVNVFWNGLFLYRKMGIADVFRTLLRESPQFFLIGIIVFILLLLGYFSLLDEENPILKLKCPHCKKVFSEESKKITEGTVNCSNCKQEITNEQVAEIIS